MVMSFEEELKGRVLDLAADFVGIASPPRNWTESPLSFPGGWRAGSGDLPDLRQRA